MPCNKTLSSNSSSNNNINDKIGQCLNGYIIQNIIGVGAFSVVYRVYSPNERKEYAMKFIKRQYSNSNDKQASDNHRLAVQRLELLFHSRVNNIDGVLRMVDNFEFPDGIYILFEYANAGDLCEKLTDFWLEPRQIKVWFKQILLAVYQCHQRQIYHRDIKPENVLIMDDGSVKLCDFGLATDELVSLDYGIGTASYMSPAIYAKSESSYGYCPNKADIWSLGILLFAMVTRKNPWSSPCTSDPSFLRYTHDPIGLMASFRLSPTLIEVLFNFWNTYSQNSKLEDTIEMFDGLREDDLVCDDLHDGNMLRSKLVSWASMDREFDNSCDLIGVVSTQGTPQLSPILEVEFSQGSVYLSDSDDTDCDDYEDDEVVVMYNNNNGGEEGLMNHLNKPRFSLNDIALNHKEGPTVVPKAGTFGKNHGETRRTSLFF